MIGTLTSSNVNLPIEAPVFLKKRGCYTYQNKLIRFWYFQTQTNKFVEKVLTAYDQHLKNDH